MEKQNVTLSLPKDILQKAETLANEKNITLSEFLALLIVEKVTEKFEYERAHQNFLTLMEHHPILGIGKITWTRDELHER